MGKNSHSRITNKTDYLRILKQGRRQHLSDWVLLISLIKKNSESVNINIDSELFFKSETIVNDAKDTKKTDLNNKSVSNAAVQELEHENCLKSQVSLKIGQNTVAKNIIYQKQKEKPYFSFEKPASDFQSYITLKSKSNELILLRYGITVSRKVGNAVVRNRLKRLVKSYFSNIQIVSNSFKTFEKKKYMDINVIFKPKTIQFYKSIKSEDIKQVFDNWIKSI